MEEDVAALTLIEGKKVEEVRKFVVGALELRKRDAYRFDVDGQKKKIKD